MRIDTENHFELWIRVRNFMFNYEFAGFLL